MFNNDMPAFFLDPNIANYFAADVAELFTFKTHETFDGAVLKQFMDAAEMLENSLLEYNNLITQKIEYGNQLKKNFDENIEKMRDLNDQICVQKIEKKTFGKKYYEKEYGEAIDTELIEMMKEE